MSDPSGSDPTPGDAPEPEEERIKRPVEKLPIEKQKLEKLEKNEKLEYEKQHKLEKNEVKELKERKPEFDKPAGTEGLPQGKLPVERDVLLQHADALERAARELRHFIGEGERPDLRRGALEDEPDDEGRP